MAGVDDAEERELAFAFEASAFSSTLRPMKKAMSATINSAVTANNRDLSPIRAPRNKFSQVRFLFLRDRKFIHPFDRGHRSRRGGLETSDKFAQGCVTQTV